MMKAMITTTIFFLSAPLFAQSTTEAAILKLSAAMFKWEVENKIDSLASLFHEKLMVVGSTGDIQSKSQYLAILSSGNFVHNNIDVQESIATVVNNTATVMGKGKFTVAVSGNKKILHLSYMEVYTKENNGWKLLALSANKLPD